MADGFLWAARTSGFTLLHRVQPTTQRVWTWTVTANGEAGDLLVVAGGITMWREGILAADYALRALDYVAWPKAGSEVAEASLAMQLGPTQGAPVVLQARDDGRLAVCSYERVYTGDGTLDHLAPLMAIPEIAGIIKDVVWVGERLLVVAQGQAFLSKEHCDERSEWVPLGSVSCDELYLAAACGPRYWLLGRSRRTWKLMGPDHHVIGLPLNGETVPVGLTVSERYCALLCEAWDRPDHEMVLFDLRSNSLLWRMWLPC